jgi:hypothetical protein
MSSPAFEALLARLYTDAALRSRFLDDARREAVRAGLSDDECRALASIDREGLRLAAESLAAKRAPPAGRCRRS